MKRIQKKAENHGDASRRFHSIISSPVGSLTLVADESALIGVYFESSEDLSRAAGDCWLNPHHPLLREAEQQLHEYFAQNRKTFSVPLRFAGTDFQRNVWQQIAKIPYGETISYSELASRSGAANAIRAAGTATGRNPISIIVPCHRVMGKNGSMCGFGGGLDRKRFLLQLESQQQRSLALPFAAPRQSVVS